MVCAHCGALSDEGQRFCYNCGARMTPPAAQATQSAPTIPASFAPRSPAPLQPINYPPAPINYPPAVIPNSALAITSLIAGILAWIFPLVIIIGAVVAVICGHMARGEIRRSGGRLGGDGLAVIGMVLGYAQLGLLIVGGCLLLFVIAVLA